MIRVTAILMLCVAIATEGASKNSPREQVASLQADIRRLQATVDELRQELQQKNSEIVKLASDSELRSDQLAATEEKLTYAERANDLLREDLSAAQRHASSSSRKASEGEVRNNALEVRLLQCKSEVDQLRDEILEIGRANDALKSEAARHQQEFEAMDRLRREHSDKVRQWSETHQQLRTQLEEFHREHGEASHHLAETDPHEFAEHLVALKRLEESYRLERQRRDSERNDAEL